MTEDQTKLLEIARKACARAHEEAQKCHQSGLPILAREWDHWAREMFARIELQERALSQESLSGESR